METANLMALIMLAVAVLGLLIRLLLDRRKASNPHSDHELLVEINDTLEAINLTLAEIKVHVENTWNKVNT